MKIITRSLISKKQFKYRTKGNPLKNKNLKELISVGKTTAQLGIIQIAGALLPLVLLPYLAGILKKETLAVYLWAISAVQLSAIITEYGFGLYGIVAGAEKLREGKSHLQKMYSSISLARLLLMFLTITAFIFAISFHTEMMSYFSFLMIFSVAIAAQSLFPVWIAQIIGCTGKIAITISTSRIAFVALVFLLVKNEKDILYIPISYALTQLIATYWSLKIIKKNGYTIKKSSWSEIFNVLNLAKEYFISRASVSVYGVGATVILGMHASLIEVAKYAIADQVFRGVTTIFGPISQATYGYMARTKNLNIYKIIFIVFVMIGLTIAILTGTHAGSIIKFISGATDDQSELVLKIMSIAMVFAICSMLIGYPLLAVFGHAKRANRSVMYAGALQVVLLIFLINSDSINAINLAVIICIAEFIVLSTRFTLISEIHNNHKEI